jgi:hypothetical protein
MSGCNMLEQAATCPAMLQQAANIPLQHARTGENMSGCNMLEQAANVRLQHV